jgi:hypothetical protein
MTSVKKLIREYRTLDEIRERKDELLEELEQDNTKITTMWNQIFMKRENNTKSDYIASIVSNGIVAFDTFMLIRKLMKGYGFLFGKKKKQKKSFL